MMELYFPYGEKEIDYLRKKDKKLSTLIDCVGMIQRRVNPCPFSSLIESVVAQQISTKAAATVFSKLVAACGAGTLPAMCSLEVNQEKTIRVPLTPDALNTLSVEEIQSCGMSMVKANYIKNIAIAAVNKTVDFSTLPNKSDKEIIETLTAIKGIGIWTAEMLLIFSLMRPDIVSYGDLIIRRSIMQLYGHKELPKERFMRYVKRYSPYGSVASLYLWALAAIE